MDKDTRTTFATVKYTEIDNKLVKDGKMALMITHSYHVRLEEIRYDPVLIDMILQDSSNNEIENYLNDITHNHIPDRYKNFKGRVQIVWIPLGTLFMIERCADNGEFIVTVQNDVWEMA